MADNIDVLNIGIVCDSDNKAGEYLKFLDTSINYYKVFCYDLDKLRGYPKNMMIDDCVKILVYDVIHYETSIYLLIHSLKQTHNNIKIISIVENNIEAEFCLANGADYHLVRDGNEFRALDCIINKLKAGLKNEKATQIKSTNMNMFSEYSQSLIQYIPLGVIITSDDNIININQQAYRILRINSNYSDVNSIIDKDLFGAFPEILFDYENEIFNYELQISLDNEAITLSINSSIIKTAYESTGSASKMKFTVFRDVSKIRKLEEHVLELRKIASLGHISAGIAHEIRNPLTSMNMFCSYMLGSFDENDDRKSIMEKVVSEIKRLENLVKNISSFSKTTPVNKSVINLYHTVENTLFFVKQYIKKKNIVVKNNVDKNLMLFADLERLKQVLINIFINAINAMSSGGEMLINAEKNTESTLLEVADTGKGIPDEIIENIFEPFFTTNSRSSGLGLSIVKKIIAQHNGDIIIKNREDGVRGTLVVIKFPRILSEDDI